jgi:hypothetical protein
VIDFLLLAAAVVGALWLAALVYHNHLGGHVEGDEVAAPSDPGR